MPFFYIRGIALGKVTPDLILNGSNPISLKLLCLCTIRNPKSSLRAQLPVLFLYEVIDFKTELYVPSIFLGHVRLSRLSSHICKCFLISKTDSQLLEEQEKLTNDKHFFDEQRATLESERKQLTDAAIKLGHEVGVGNKYQISIYL